MVASRRGLGPANQFASPLALVYKLPSSAAADAMKPAIEIYDTTLRDGTQGEGINFSVADKLRIAERLDEFGVDYIEGGWPGSQPEGHRVLRAGQTAQVAATPSSPPSA